MGYKVQKQCRVCGKLYTPCGDCERDKTAFHWRSVACSRECGAEYLKRIEASRTPVVSKLEETPIFVESDIAKEADIDDNNIDVNVISERKSFKKNNKKQKIIE